MRAGVWRLADPKISLASMAAMFLGTMAAWRDGPLAPGWLALTVLGVFCVEVAKNASGEVFDWDSGTDQAVAPEDRSPFSGGKRVMVDGLLTRGQTWAVAVAGYGLALVAGAIIVLRREPAALAWGAAGGALAFFYHAPPLRLAYRGLGELAVGLAYGPGLVGATYLVQRGDVPARVVWLGVPLGLLTAAFLWINEFPDYRADRSAGKRNLVVRLGRPAAARVYVALLAGALGCVAALPLVGAARGAWLGLLAAVPAGLAARRLLRGPEATPNVVPAQAATLLALIVLAAASGLGLLVL